MSIKKMRVRDIMQPEPKTIEREVGVNEAARQMQRLGVSCLIVPPADDSDAFGVVTRKDILDAMLTDEEGGFSSTVGDVMTKPAITVGESLSIENCLLLMRVAGARRLPVVEGCRLLGLITSTDVFNRLVAEV